MSSLLDNSPTLIVSFPPMEAYFLFDFLFLFLQKNHLLELVKKKRKGQIFFCFTMRQRQREFSKLFLKEGQNR